MARTATQNKRIRAIADAIENRADTKSPFKGKLGFNMGDYVHEIWGEEDSHRDEKLPACGTTACIAGWSYALRTKDINPVFTEYFEWDKEAAWLGLTFEEAEALFYSTNLTDDQAVNILRLIADDVDVIEALNSVDPFTQEA